MPTEGNKLCLHMAEMLAKCFSVGPSEQAVVGLLKDWMALLSRHKREESLMN